MISLAISILSGGLYFLTELPNFNESQIQESDLKYSDGYLSVSHKKTHSRHHSNIVSIKTETNIAVTYNCLNKYGGECDDIFFGRESTFSKNIIDGTYAKVWWYESAEAGKVIYRLDANGSNILSYDQAKNRYTRLRETNASLISLSRTIFFYIFSTFVLTASFPSLCNLVRKLTKN